MLFSSLLRGFEIWDDGTCILRPACKTHIGPTAALADVVLPLNTSVFRICSGSEEERSGADGFGAAGGPAQLKYAPHLLHCPGSDLEAADILAESVCHSSRSCLVCPLWSLIPILWAASQPPWLLWMYLE